MSFQEISRGLGVGQVCERERLVILRKPKPQELRLIKYLRLVGPGSCFPREGRYTKGVTEMIMAKWVKTNLLVGKT